MLPELPGLPTARTALLLVDFINPLRFEGAAALAEPALAAARVASALKREMATQGTPAVYVNDNFGHWQSDFAGLVRHCRARRGAPASLVRHLRPQPEDFTVLKPRHSAFYGTPLRLLLESMSTRELILTGLSTDQCVMFTAMEAFQLGYRLWVPADCTAAESMPHKQAALTWMARTLRASIQPVGL